MSGITLISGKTAFISRIFRAGKYLEISRKYPENTWKHREISGKPPEISKIPLLQGSPERDSVPRSAPPFCPGQVPPPPTGSLCVLPLLRKSRLRLFGSGYIIILRTGLAPDN